MMVLAIYSPDDSYDADVHRNYANIYVLDAIKRVPGANQAPMFGSPDYAMRVWLKPDRMAQLGITAHGRAAGDREPEPAVRASAASAQPPTAAPVQQTFVVTTRAG